MNIYLSPHNDDVCFSIGHLASQAGGELVTIFTIGDYVAAPIALPSDPVDRIAFVSALRREEDLQFAKSMGLERHDLGLAEPMVSGRGPFDLAELAEHVGHVAAKLIPFVLALLPSDSNLDTAKLYCPMGIGRHRDHVAVLLAVHGAYEALSRRCSLFLYEDLYYARIAEVRREGVAAAIRLFANAKLVPFVIPLDGSDAEQKLKRASLYASQLNGPPQLGDLTPASSVGPAPHEIVWRVSAADSQP